MLLPKRRNLLHRDQQAQPGGIHPVGGQAMPPSKICRTIAKLSDEHVIPCSGDSLRIRNETTQTTEFSKSHDKFESQRNDLRDDSHCQCCCCCCRPLEQYNLYALYKPGGDRHTNISGDGPRFWTKIESRASITNNKNNHTPPPRANETIFILPSDVWAGTPSSRGVSFILMEVVDGGRL